jgi:hypothetical protein
MTRFQTAVVAVAAAAFGWWAHSSHPVEAQSGELRYEFHGLGPETALSLYNPADQTIYVYQGAVTGYSTLQCSYKFHVPKPGGPIERTNCPIGSLR